MRSRGRLLPALAMILLAASVCGAQESPPTGTFTRDEVAKAVEEIKKDPNLSQQRTMRTLKWASKPEDRKKARDLSGFSWIRDLFGWLTESGRYLFWGGLAVLVGFLLVYLWRLVRSWSSPAKAARVTAPSFVHDLDIRPESLPADVGAAARKLWNGGEHRSALALLYRGLLSRLVHVHQVPIRDSSTEGDCLALANRHLKDEERKSYVASLVRLWQRAVYGGEAVPTEAVYALCDGFARALDQPEVAAAPSGPAAAGARA